MFFWRTLLLINICFGTWKCRCQTNTFEKIKSDSNSYFNFVLYPNSKSQNYLITASYQCVVTSVGKVFGTQGGISSIGINFARLISRKIVFGVVFDCKLIPGFFSKRTSSHFVSDFDARLNSGYNSQLDSANGSILKNAFSNGPGQYFIGNQMTNIGVMVSLFPQKYGGILLQVKQGYRSFYIHGVNKNPYVDNGESDSKAMDLNRNILIDLTIKPLAFFKNTYLRKGDKRENGDLWNRLVVTFYYERLNFWSAQFNGTKLKDVVSEEFMRKYGVDHRFGVKIGLGFY